MLISGQTLIAVIILEVVIVLPVSQHKKIPVRCWHLTGILNTQPSL
jgi:hypothetical protein